MNKILGKIFNVRTPVFIVLFIEIAIIAVLIIYFNQYLFAIRSILSLIAVVTALLIFNSHCSTSYKIAWLCLMVLFPIFGSLCYLLFANKKFTKKEKRVLIPIADAMYKANMSPESNNCVNSIDPNLDPNAYFFGKYLNEYSVNGIYKNSKVTYYPWGELAWKDMLIQLEKAKHYIFMEYFIIQEGVMWNSMLDILKRKASEGVDVRLMYDDLGCISTLKPSYYKTIRSYGIKCVAVNRVRARLDIRMNNRDHRKIMVIDGHTGFTGGINLADEYINEIVRFGKWKDNAIKIEGDAVYGLTSMFLTHWCTTKDYFENISDFSPYLANKYKHEIPEVTGASGYIAPYGSLPYTFETIGENIYLSLIMKAKKYIYITTPYLILDEQLNNALQMAAKGGVKIKLLTPHIPDKKIVFDLTRSYYRDLIEAGVEVYEYTPGFVHAKTFVVDGYMATVGTINLDYRSLYLHLENGCFIYKSDCIKDIENDMVETFQNSTMITAEMVNSSPVYKRFFRAILKLFSSAL